MFDSIALKRLLRQLFTSDAEFFDIHTLAQHILTSAGQMGIGTTVKVDGTESDPYAYISLVDLSNIDVSICPLSLYSRKANLTLISFLLPEQACRQAPCRIPHRPTADTISFPNAARIDFFPSIENTNSARRLRETSQPARSAHVSSMENDDR